MSSSPSASRSRGVRLHAARLWPEGLASPSTCARVWRGPSVSSSVHLGTKLCSDSIRRNKPRRMPWRLTGAYLLLCFLGNRHTATTNSALTTTWTRSLWVQNLKPAPRDLHACTVPRELLRQGGERGRTRAATGEILHRRRRVLGDPSRRFFVSLGILSWPRCAEKITGSPSISHRR
jgi:hypothetical protein